MENHKAKTRFRELNILNLGYGQFPSNNKYGIPTLKQTNIEEDIIKKYPLQGFNYALTSKHPYDIGVHFFLHDYQFERVWEKPSRYADVLSKFRYVLSPDFSPYADMPIATQLYNVYRNRWCGTYWQSQGITVIPTITLGSPELFDACVSGVEKNSIIAISTMGEGRWGDYKGIRSYWNKILTTLEPKAIILYGKDLSKELPGNIIYKPYNSSRS